MRLFLIAILSASSVWGGVFLDGTRVRDTQGALGTAVGNLDSDAADEFVSIATSSAHFRIYDYTGGAWVEHEVLTGVEVGAKQDRFGTEIVIADIDDDGDNDIAVVDSSNSGNAGELFWYENPGSLAGSWTEHSVSTWSGSGAGNLITHSEVAAGDINGDGMIDLVARDISHGFWVFIQDAPGDGSTWETRKFVATNPREGIWLADLDEDDDLDIIINGVWYETPADPVGGTYTQRTYAANWYPGGASGEQIDDYACQVRTADFDGDGDLDIVITNSEELANGSTTTTKPNGIRVYLCPADPVNDAWVEVILHSSNFSWHSCAVGDFDRDGDVDVISGISEVGADTASALIMLFKNDGDGTSFTQETIDTGTEGGTSVYMYQGKAGDYDGDGDLDLFAPNDWDSGPIWIYANLSGEYAVPSTNRIDWAGTTGIPGGIPNRTTIYQTFSPGVTAAQLQTAIDDCPSNQVVYLNAGTYSFSTAINFKSNKGVTLRGAGQGETILNLSSGGAGHFLSDDYGTANTLSISSGYTKGSSNIIVSSTTGYSVGDLIDIDQTAETGLVYPNTGRKQSQRSKVTALTGTQITFWPPLIWTFKAAFSPEVKRQNGVGMVMCGIEDMSLISNGNATYICYWLATDSCWVKNVEFEGFDEAAVALINSLQFEYRECYAHDTSSTDQAGYGIYLWLDTSHCRVEDNIFENVMVGVLATKSVGYAILYNFTTNSYNPSFAYQTASANANHGAQGMMALWEGNILSEGWQNDAYHGTTSHQVILRNWVPGLHPTKTGNKKMIDLNRGSYYHYVLGNVLGHSSWTGDSGFAYAMTGEPSYTTASVIYRIGYPNVANNSLTEANPLAGMSSTYPDTNVAATAVIHGNYDTHTDGIVLTSALNTDIPDSLYYSSKPAYFGDLDWPPFNPSSPASADVQSIPAGYRYVNGEEGGGETGGGTGGGGSASATSARVGTIRAP